MTNEEIKEEVISQLLKGGKNKLSAGEFMMVEMLIDNWMLYKEGMEDLKQNGAVLVSAGRNGDIKKTSPYVDLSTKTMTAVLMILKNLELVGGNAGHSDVHNGMSNGFSMGERPG